MRPLLIPGLKPGIAPIPRKSRVDEDVEMQSEPMIGSQGAQCSEDGVTYRVWAPDHERAAVCIHNTDADERRVALSRDADGYFEGLDPAGKPGDLYSYDFGDGRKLPDPASRFQPKGVHGPSQVVDPRAYTWHTVNWAKPKWRGQPIYELHVGAFSEDGTFCSAIERLDHLVELGIEAIEIMPIADFAGDRNWGYDGVAIYAPARCYGTPDDFRALVDAAHQRGLLVILDVVYNHLGPAGNYLAEFAKDYFHPTRTTPWGQAFNIDAPHCRPVRDFFVENAMYWIDEYRVDGLRLDATHTIEDASERHLLAEIADAVHARSGFVIAEDERNAGELFQTEDGRGIGLDAVWSDDFHHQVRVALTGVRESYFASYAGTPDELAVTLQNGWFYTGQAFPFWNGRTRGAPSRNLPPSAFVYCIENHDQVGNRALGERLEHLVDPALFRAASMLLCLNPYAPLLFMGQEWAASSPFLFFTNHEGELGRAVSEGRRKEFAQAGLNKTIRPEDIPDPQELMTFVRSKLDWTELQAAPHRQVFALYRECLRARKEWIKPFATQREGWSVSVAGPAVVLRFEHEEDRPALLLVVSLQPGTVDTTNDDPLLVPRDGYRWRPEVHTEDPHFGGSGRIGGAAMHASHAPRPWLHFERAGAVLLIEEKV